MNASERWRCEKLAKELARHQERIAWLSTKNPVWSCGAPVDAYARQSMLSQSEKHVKIIAEQLRPLRDTRNA
jgi:hypothetical protein